MTRYVYPPHEDIVAGVAREGSRAAYARSIAIPVATFAEYLSRRPDLHSAVNDGLAKKFVTPAASEVTREEKLEAEVAELRTRVRATRKSDVQFQRVLDEVRAGIAAAEVKYEPSKHDPDKQPKAHVQELMFSDVHYGEVVRAEEVGNLNAYDTRIARRRISHVQHAVESFVSTKDYQVEELVLSCLGDMVSSGPGIHDEIRETDEITSSEQAVEFGLILGSFIEELVPTFPHIRVLGVPGNHPRMAKPHASKRVFNNFDWVAYKVAETYLRGYIAGGAIECNFPKAGMIIDSWAGMNHYRWHGDGIKSTMPGVPWGGVMRRVNEIRKQFMNSRVNPIRLDTFGLGHFHDPAAVTSILMNGALTGTNEHGIKNYGGSAEPTQLLVTYYPPKRKITGVEFITPE